jgi:GNAT superfamily N-acetyltransferase
MAKLDNLAIAIRAATPEDIPEILRQRRAMYEAMGERDDTKLSAMGALSQEYLQRAVVDGSFRSWLAHVGARVAGGGAIVISPWPAHPYDLECRRATILNVFTYPEFRRQGVARGVMLEMIAWCRRENFAGVTLHASDDGRHLYESLGFQPSNEMKLKLR